MKNSLKIAILTQPLHDNYGGLLQAYALKEVLNTLGHEAIIIDRRGGKPKGLRKIASRVKGKLLGREVISKRHQDIISKETISFREKYIPNLSEVIEDNQGMYKLNNMNFDAYIVGSDQCWRPKYSPYIRNYFLDFAKEKSNIKRLSFAASFGVSDWEFTDEETQDCKELLQRFDAISVREKSGIDLVKKHLGRNDAVHLIDPTMLLATDDYKKIAAQEKTKPSDGNLKVYVLDKSDSKMRIIRDAEKKLGLKMFEVLPKKRLGSEPVTNQNVTDFAYPNPVEWLRAYQDAKFVITDSFHGTAFSIMFNVPFISIGNPKRGMARFESLLGMFDLEDRLISDDLEHVKIDTIINNKINWDKVNQILDKEKIKALDFLKSNLD
ncbi:polysaccharide pyruvyl transferase family protein [Aequorivita capsosiphonis]|uniref:polysaccharide pyruvyl transferase family protein n=1 Tax=Aequorivita capsosiphonis TaxID=487317 RepID=UPI000418C8E7|nr:polysaccharide pyruvyl transferase family protein [Aequorivita capsosiphonis]